jgi:hypothetical protein
VCGKLAAYLASTQPDVLASGVRVRLKQPPPLDRDLRIEQVDTGLALLDDTTLVAEAWGGSLDLKIPDAVSLDVATQAARRFRGFEEHYFPSCFVCGPEREEGDGLRIFPGRLGDEHLFAAPWHPDVSLGDREGRVDPAFVWAALDCPGCFCFPQPDRAFVLLGEMTAAVLDPIEIDQPCVLLSWLIAKEGRKRMTGTAIYADSGRCHGFARAIWIVVPEERDTRGDVPFGARFGTRDSRDALAPTLRQRRP